MKCLIDFPKSEQTLPTADMLDYVVNLPLVQIVVTSRSGSYLFQSYFDDHQQILQMPYLFKFYDFVAEYPDLLSMDVQSIVEAFVTYEAHQPLFNTQKSVITGGGLGEDKNVFIKVNLQSFKSACLAMLTESKNYKTLFCAFIAAYSWCLGYSIENAKVVLQQLHHGDWIFPEYLVDKTNCQKILPEATANILKADLYIVTIRHPIDCVSSMKKFIAQLDITKELRQINYEAYLRLLVQDWYRLSNYITKKTNFCLLEFQDLRHNKQAIIEKICEKFNLDKPSSASINTTFYGYHWHGDIYTAPNKQETIKPINFQDKAYITYLILPLMTQLGYSVDKLYKVASIPSVIFYISLLLPSMALFNIEGRWVKKIYFAYKMSIQRWKFTRKIKQQYRDIAQPNNLQDYLFLPPQQGNQ